MKMRMLAAVAVLGGVVAANAQTIDGTAEGLYGSALFVQSNHTAFGNSTSGTVDVALGGSEIDGFFGIQAGGALSGVVTGNLESNFNKMVLFIDTGVGGFNTVGSNNASSDDFGFLNQISGFTFDAGFNASHALWIRNGGDPNTVFFTLARLGDAGSGGGDLVTGSATGPAGTIRTWNTGGLQGALNNSNVGGVSGDSANPGSGAGVVTGFEFSIANALLGNPTGDIKVAGFISGGTFISNQVIGGLPAGSGNLGNSSMPNFSTIAGNQFAVVPVPEPGTMAALGLGALALMRRRKKA